MITGSQASLTYLVIAPILLRIKCNLQHIILSTTKDQNYFLSPAKIKGTAEVITYTFQRLKTPTFFKMWRLGTREIK